MGSDNVLSSYGYVKYVKYNDVSEEEGRKKMFSSNQVLEAAKFWAATVRLLRRDRHMMQRISKNRSSEFPSPATSGKFITFGYDRI